MTQKLWWITGGGSGIGRALAQSVAADGHKVVITGRRIEPLEETASGSNNILIHQADVTDASGLAAIVAEIEARHGPIDVAILNAAQYQPMDLADFDARLFSQMINTNLLGVANPAPPRASDGKGA